LPISDSISKPKSATLEVSIVIPVFNEKDVLPMLFSRLYPALDSLGRSYEILFVDDGSQDGSSTMLEEQQSFRPDVTRVLYLSSNAGQHAAITAGFQYVRGRYTITLDADLQNPPENILAIIKKMDEGFDYVGTIRETRNDQSWRHISSRIMNAVRERITSIRMTDQGCMMRGYSREITLAIAETNESHTFIPALGYLYSAQPVEITITHEKRAAGRSKYSLFKLIQLNFDLITGFSSLPLRLISFTGIVVSLLSLLFVIFLAIRRFTYGPEAEGLFTLFGIAIFMMGLILFSVGMLGEYIGRINNQVRKRQWFRVARVLDSSPTQTANSLSIEPPKTAAAKVRMVRRRGLQTQHHFESRK